MRTLLSILLGVSVAGFLGAICAVGLYFGRIVTFDYAFWLWLNAAVGGGVAGIYLRAFTFQPEAEDEHAPAIYGSAARAFLSLTMGVSIGGFVGAATAAGLYFGHVVTFDSAFWIWVVSAVVGGVVGAMLRGSMPEVDPELQGLELQGLSANGDEPVNRPYFG